MRLVLGSVGIHRRARLAEDTLRWVNFRLASNIAYWSDAPATVCDIKEGWDRSQISAEKLRF
jgi:hypothetical protein